MTVPPSETSPRWSTATKFLVSLVFVALAGGLLVRFETLVAPLLMAFILAYLLSPAAQWLQGRTGLPWGASVNLVYLALLLALLVGLTAVGIALVQQAVSLYDLMARDLPDLPARLQEALAHPVQVGPWLLDLSRPLQFGPFTLNLSTLNLGSLYSELLSTLQPLFSRTSTVLGTLASGTFELLGWTLFVLVVSFYLLHSLHDLMPGLEQAMPAGYAHDVRRMASELTPLWNAFLRGQVTLSLVMGVVVGLVMSLLGLRYALVIGLLAGLFEFMPIVGPVMVAAVAAVVALFQPSNWLGLPPLYFALLVIGAQTVMQQLESNLLVPRIIGDSLKLHPAVIMVGLLLSAPALATLRVFGRYAYRKLFDLDPWPEPPPPPVRPPAFAWRPWLRQLAAAARRRLGWRS